ncbi:MAG: hypothetical protein ACREJU_20085 [Nitrospiraceae bacterium]
MELNIGTNRFRNANGVIKVQAKEQIVLQIQDEDCRLFLTMDLYDSAGNHLAHLRRNAWAFNTKNRFEIQTSPASGSLFTFPTCLKLLDKESDDPVLDIHLVEKDTIHILHGRVYSYKGQLLEITPHCWRFPGRPTMFGSVQDVRGGMVVIG